jgi:hypothetical protein
LLLALGTSEDQKKPTDLMLRRVIDSDDSSLVLRIAVEIGVGSLEPIKCADSFAAAVKGARWR